MLRLEPMRPVDPLASGSGAGHLTLLALAGALMIVGDASAQTFLVRPSVATRLTYSDNINAVSDNEKSDWVAEVAPSIAISREEGRFTGRLHATLRNVIHASETDRNTSFVALQGNGRVEAIADRLFIDMDAATSRDNTSGIFGRASQDFLGTDSSNETRQFSIAPQLLFRIGDAGGSASHRLRWVDGGGALVRRTVGQSQVELSDPTAFGRAGWGLSYGRTDTSYYDDVSSGLTEEIARATLFLNLSAKLRLRGIVGYESNDYSVGREQKGTIAGGGFDWHPTPRTLVAADAEDRFIGRTYNLKFNHRRPLSAWDFSFSRNITSSLDTDGSVFNDPAFRSLYDALAAAIPDPLQREAFVRVLLGYPAPAARGGFVTNNYFVSRTLRGSFSLIGARNTLTFSLQRLDNSRLGDPLVSDIRDDFAAFDKVETDTATLSLQRRLSARTSMNASLTRTRSTGGSATGEDAETRRTVLSVGLSGKFGAYTDGALTYRHQRADGTTDFTENVLTASLGMQF